MKFSWSKRTRIFGVIVFVAMLVFLIINRGAFLASEDLEHGKLLFFLAILACVLCGATLTLKLEFKDKRLGMIATMIWFFLAPIISITMVEAFSSIFIYDFAPKYFVANYICFMLFMLLAFAITGHIGRAIIFPNCFFYGFALTNNIVTTFRGTPFVPTDILSIGTAANVAANYDRYIDFGITMGTFIMIFIVITSFKIRSVRITNRKHKIFARLVSIGCVLAMCALFYGTDVIPNAGIKPDFWNQLRGYNKSGSLLNFMLNTKYIHVSEPDGYDADEIESLVESLASQSDYEPTITDTEDMPNIIAVMNESYSDLTVDGEFETNVDYMEFYDSLSENAIKGNLFMPVNGAGTSNSEFEFLTGLSLSFLPSGSNVYNSYIDSEIPSLVSTLGDLGYSKTAFHPYYESGWNRTTVYPLLGFDDFVSIEDIIDQDIIDQYIDSDNNVYLYESLLKQEYGEEADNMLVRRYISDSYDYEQVEKIYEEKKDDGPVFEFNVTMQNHGGYATSYYNFDEEVEITSMSKIYNLANQYLSLIKVSDEAFKELIEYYEDVDEPTIIVMFGDHQPFVETAFYEELFGTSVNSLTTEQLQCRYMTPFIIWANYDIEEATYEQMSSNYLSSLLLKTAGLPMTDFNKYLLELYEEIPVIDSVGYITKDGEYYTYNDETEYTDLLNDYEKIQYNALFDDEGRVKSVFYLSED
ncbi:MAG: LTA synthase family protein [Eubacterium sp.]|nr:LTA synthase family protein [Eubacterium sp.]